LDHDGVKTLQTCAWITNVSKARQKENDCFSLVSASDWPHIAYCSLIDGSDWLTCVYIIPYLLFVHEGGGQTITLNLDVINIDTLNPPQ